MNIYISGISGTGMGALALLASDAGEKICGSDLKKGDVADELLQRDIPVYFGKQDGAFLQECYDKTGVDWFVYTSALPQNHPELQLAQKLGLRTAKRDELINYLIEKQGSKLVAVAGTHGKTTTTGMLVWACQQLHLPISYLVGTTLPFTGAGHYDQTAQFFIYEADEYDRNFLAFHPWIGAITVATYDHPDIYKTEAEYHQAFSQFESQSEHVIRGGEIDPRITLPGEARRIDATLALKCIQMMTPDTPEAEIIAALNSFPGVGRRFEEIAPGVYSDYGHHPEEIAATLSMAQEQAKLDDLKGVVLVYEPHQNIRQHQIRQQYRDAFQDADKVFWLPTFLTREDPNLPVLTPEDLIKNLNNSEVAESAASDDALATKLKNLQKQGYLILLMTAGPADRWFRSIFA